MIIDKRLLTLLSVTIACFVFFAVGTLTADDMPQEIQIASEGYKRKIYKPVKFTHLIHVEDYGVESDECHHDYKDGENIWEEGVLAKNVIGRTNQARENVRSVIPRKGK